MGLSLEDVRQTLITATVDAPKGSFDGADQGFTIYSNDQLLEASEYNDVVIAYRNGAAVHIRDIGLAVAGPENMRIAAWQKGRIAKQLVNFTGQDVEEHQPLAVLDVRFSPELTATLPSP